MHFDPLVTTLDDRAGDRSVVDEQCVERVFVDILRQCQPTELSVWARYTRRGGLDINPCRRTPGLPAPASLAEVRQ